MTEELQEKINEGIISQGLNLAEELESELNEGVVVEEKDLGLLDGMYSSEAIKEIVCTHIANIRASSLQLEGITAGDIEYDNPEVHPQMMMDNLKDASKRLEIALSEIGRLSSLTGERRKQLANAKSVNLNDLKTGIAGEFIE